MKKVFYICNRYTANQDIIVNKFGRQVTIAKGLTTKDYKVILYCADYKKYESFEKDFENIKLISVHLKLTSLLSYVVKLYKRIKKENPDVIIGGSVPLWGFIGFVLSKLIGKKFIYDIQDNYEIADKTTFGAIGVRLHKINLLFTKNIIVVSDSLQKKYKNKNKNIAVIPNSIDLNKFKPLSQEFSKKLFKLDQNKKYIGYFGSIAKNRGIDELQKSVIELAKTHKDIILILAGGINDETILKDQSIVYLGNLSPDKMPSLINAIDLVVIPNPENEFTKYCFPYKVLEAMACNKKILIGKSGFLKSLNLPKNFYISDPNNITKFKDDILRQLNTKKFFHLIKIASKYNVDNITNDLDYFISNIIRKKVAIICDNVDDNKRTGTANYALNLINNLEDNNEFEYIIVHKKYKKGLFKGNKKELIIPNYGNNFILNTIRKIIIMPYILIRHNVDIVHETYQMGPFVLPLLPFKKVVTIHDIFFKTYPRTHNRISRIRHTLSLPIILKHVNYIITDSLSSKKDIRKHYGIKSNKIKVIYLGADSVFKKITNKKLLKSVKEKYKLPSKFILTVSTVEPRKNILTVIKAIHVLKEKGLDIKYIVIGKKTYPYMNELNLYIEGQNLTNHIIFLDYIDYEDLPLIYNLAYAFIFPSFYEGFGLPLLEAITSGCPAITSDISSLPEVVGDAGLFTNPFDPKELANNIAKLYSNKNLRRYLINKGLMQARKFSWEFCALHTYHIYETFK